MESKLIVEVDQSGSLIKFQLLEVIFESDDLCLLIAGSIVELTVGGRNYFC